MFDRQLMEEGLGYAGNHRFICCRRLLGKIDELDVDCKFRQK